MDDKEIKITNTDDIVILVGKHVEFNKISVISNESNAGENNINQNSIVK